MTIEKMIEAYLRGYRKIQQTNSATIQDIVDILELIKMVHEEKKNAPS